LRDANLDATRSEAQTIYYTNADPPAGQLLALLLELDYPPDKRATSPRKDDDMNIERAVLPFAGTMVFVSLLLSQLHHPYWLWLTAFVGATCCRPHSRASARWPSC